MKQAINILFISVVGNTKAMCRKLQKYAKRIHQNSAEDPLIKLQMVSEQTDLFKIQEPYFCFVPTYVEGGATSMDLEMDANRPSEIETLSMNEELGYAGNYHHCLGIVGSGNRNFNYLYCYTAKLYSAKYRIPVVDNYELRGTRDDVQRIYRRLVRITKQNRN